MHLEASRTIRFSLVVLENFLKLEPFVDAFMEGSVRRRIAVQSTRVPKYAALVFVVLHASRKWVQLKNGGINFKTGGNRLIRHPFHRDVREPRLVLRVASTDV